MTIYGKCQVNQFTDFYFLIHFSMMRYLYVFITLENGESRYVICQESLLKYSVDAQAKITSKMEDSKRKLMLGHN